MASKEYGANRESLGRAIGSQYVTIGDFSVDVVCRLEMKSIYAMEGKVGP